MFITCETREPSCRQARPASEKRDTRRPGSCKMSSQLPRWFASNIDPESKVVRPISWQCARPMPPKSPKAPNDGTELGQFAAHRGVGPKKTALPVGVLRCGPQQALYAMKTAAQCPAPTSIPPQSAREQCFVPASHCVLLSRRVSTARLTSHSIQDAISLAPSTPCPDTSTPLTRGKYRPESAHDLGTLGARRSAGRRCGAGGASPRVTLQVASRLNWTRTGLLFLDFVSGDGRVGLEKRGEPRVSIRQSLRPPRSLHAFLRSRPCPRRPGDELRDGMAAQPASELDHRLPSAPFNRPACTSESSTQSRKRIPRTQPAGNSTSISPKHRYPAVT